MEELLQKLLEAEVLSEDTKTELQEAFSNKLNEAVEVAKKEAAADVRAELTEQWIQERDTLIEAVDSKVSEFVEKEMSELREDIEGFRDLEAEYAQRLVESKKEMRDDLKKDLLELVEKLDTFLEIRLTAEFDELREDLEEVRKNEFGRRIFEAFINEYRDSFAEDDSTEATLSEVKKQLDDALSALEESERVRDGLERDRKLGKLLQPLSGHRREVMEAILKNVPTDKLEEGYNTFIGRVLKEAEDTSEKEAPVLAEGEKKDKKLDENKTKVVSGDTEQVIVENDNTSAAKKEHIEWARRLAGVE